jgi:hypothetical protein
VGVKRTPLSWAEAKLPDLDVLVLEEQLGADLQVPGRLCELGLEIARVKRAVVKDLRLHLGFLLLDLACALGM